MNRVKKIFAALKTEAVKVEVWVKSIASVLVGGGLNAAADIYRQGRSFELSAAHLLELKAKFISGAVIGLIGYWAKSPLGQNKTQEPGGKQ